ncbi:hypothetical protein KCU83_g548, partial [Aureobasidium melanogenum]
MESVTSSTQSTTSRIASSTSSTPPNLARSSSYSHVFPSHQNLIDPSNPVPDSNTRGLSKDTKALARRLLQNNPTVSACNDERTLLFSSGLQWLLDTATEAEKASPRPARQSTRVAPLTEDAVRNLDKHAITRQLTLREPLARTPRAAFPSSWTHRSNSHEQDHICSSIKNDAGLHLPAILNPVDREKKVRQG